MSAPPAAEPPPAGAALRRRAARGEARGFGAVVFAAAGLALLGLAAGLRFWDLSAAPVWMDEAFSDMAAQLPLKSILFGRIDNHPPLFYALQHFWRALEPSPAAMRIPAAIAGVAAVAVTGLAAADLASRRAGLAAAAFLALSTSHVYFSQDARMYPLLSLGLAAALWGLAGLAQRPGHGVAYGALYVLGGVLAVYAQVVSLIFLAALNLAVLGVLGLRRSPWRGLAPLALANLALAALSLPWLVSLFGAMGGFKGLREYGPSTAVWFFSSAVGFPGAPGWAKKPALLLLLALIAYGAARGARGGRAPLVAAALSGLVLYPLGLVALNAWTPVLEHRVFLPCALAAAMLFGQAIAELPSPGLRWPAAAAFAALALASLVAEHRARVKPEDARQALALADAAGYADAPVLACMLFPAASARYNAPGRAVFFTTPQGPVRMDQRFPRALAMSINRLHDAGAPQYAAYLGGAADAAANTAVLAAARRVVVLSAVCDSRAPDALLTRLGFVKAAAPRLRQPRPVIFSTVWTEIELWSKP